MRIITVKLPDAYLRDLDELVKSGSYPSRSEAIRTAVRDLLRRELRVPVKEVDLYDPVKGRPRCFTRSRQLD